MTSISRSWPEPTPAAAAAPANGVWSVPAHVYATLLAIVCFFPYPGLPVGNRTGVQLAEALALLAVPAVLLAPPTRAVYAFALLVVPIYLSAAVIAARGVGPQPDVLPKELISLNIALSVVLASPWVVRRRFLGRLLACAAAAALVHTAIGLYQAYSFTKSEFPLLFLYRNPSFKPMESWAEVYAMYVKRPCGLFPEPSAMAASLGPWLLVIAGVLTHGPSRNRFAPRAADRGLLTAGLLGGLLLLTLSQSGFMPIVGLALAFLAFWQTIAGPWSRGEPIGRAAVGTAAVVGTCAAGALVYLVASSAGSLDARVESSWGLRAQSIIVALNSNTDPFDLIGTGPGQSTEILRKRLAGIPLSEGQDDVAVWSVSICYYMESGLLGGLTMAVVAGMILKAVAGSSAKVFGLTAFAVWFLGVTVTTSYSHLAALWIFLGLLLEWDRVFPP